MSHRFYRVLKWGRSRVSSVYLFSLTGRVSFSLSLLLLSASASSAFFTFQVLLLLGNGVAQTTVVVAQSLNTHTDTLCISSCVYCVEDESHGFSCSYVRPSFLPFVPVSLSSSASPDSVHVCSVVSKHIHTHKHTEKRRERTL